MLDNIIGLFLCKEKVTDHTALELKNLDLHLRIKHLIDCYDENRLEAELEWLSFAVITLPTTEIDRLDKDGKCPLHRLIDKFIELKYVDKRDGDIIELMMIKSCINYEEYQGGVVVNLLRRYSLIKYYQWLILNQKENLCLEDMNANIFTRDTLIRIPQNLDDLLQIIFVVGAIKTLKVLMNMISEEYGSKYPVLATAVAYSVLVRDEARQRFYRCFDFLLSREDVDINLPDKNGETPLFIACRINDTYIMNELLKRKPFIAALNQNGDYAVTDVSRDTLNRMLDDCIVTRPEMFLRDDNALKMAKTFSMKFLNLDNIIFLDLTSFYPKEDEVTVRSFNVLELFQAIANNPDIRLSLNHPVIGAIIESKWMRLRKYILLRKLFVFLSLIAGFVLVDLEVTEKETLFFLTIIGIAIIFEILMTSQLYFSKFCNKTANFLNIAFLIGVFIFFEAKVCTKTCSEAPIPVDTFSDSRVNVEWQPEIVWSYNVVGCPAVAGMQWILLGISINYFLAFFNPRVAHYTIMLVYVAYSMLKFMISNIFMMLGFAFCYATIFYEISEDKLKIFGKIFQTFIMLTGELDDTDTSKYQSIFTYILFGFIVFMVSIVTLNLINGLAVGDVSYISSQAEFWHRRVQCMLLYELEIILKRIEQLIIKWRPKLKICSKLIRENSMMGLRTTNGDVVAFESINRHKRIGGLTMKNVKAAVKILRARERTETKQQEIFAVRKESHTICPHCFEQLS